MILLPPPLKCWDCGLCATTPGLRRASCILGTLPTTALAPSLRSKKMDSLLSLGQSGPEGHLRRGQLVTMKQKLIRNRCQFRVYHLGSWAQHFPQELVAQLGSGLTITVTSQGKGVYHLCTIRKCSLSTLRFLLLFFFFSNFVVCMGVVSCLHVCLCTMCMPKKRTLELLGVTGGAGDQTQVLQKSIHCFSSLSHPPAPVLLLKDSDVFNFQSTDRKTMI